jgi:DNA (cytosine-5)-methyltransferase 1
MNELALFAGAGGGILGGKLLGWRTVCAVELDAAAREKLLARQNDGSLAPFPIWSDVRSFTARNNAVRPVIRALRRVRNKLIVTGGFPCTDISVAGRGEGLDGAESGLWSEQRRIIGEIRPRDVLVENSPALTTRGGIRVIGDLAALGYDCRWGIVSAADSIWLTGAPCLDHLRERIWIAGTRADPDRVRELQPQRRECTERGRAGDEGRESADAECAERRPLDRARHGLARSECVPQRQEGASRAGVGDQTTAATSPNADRDRVRKQPITEFGCGCPSVVGRTCETDTDANGAGRIEQRTGVANGEEHEATERRGWWAAEPGVGRMVNGLAGRVDRLTCTGNGQVPHAMALAWEILTR